MSYFDVLKQVKNNQISPVYLLYGTESYFIQNIRKQMTQTLLPDDEDNSLTYDLEETPIEDVINDVETYPFFGEKKLIIANNPTFLQARPASLPFEHRIDSLEAYVQNPVDYSVLLLIAPYEKLDQRKRITKTVRKYAQVVECHPIKDRDLTRWIKNLATHLNITIAHEAIEVFEANLTTNLHLLQNEIAKCAQYVGSDGIVTKDIAEKLLSHTPTSSALQLVDAVIEHNLHKAISIYKNLEKMNEEPIALIALLAFQFRMILRVKLLKQKGYNEFQIQKKVGGHPYVIKIAYQRERRFSVEKLEAVINALTVADARIKQGRLAKDIAFELLLFDLMQPA